MQGGHYERDSLLPFGEDSRHEFKGHRNLSVEELPKWCFIPGTNRRSRRAVSRALNGFLNTGEGGTVYLGVTDEGKVKGLYLTQAQAEHVRVSLTDLMSRYKPRVTKSKYRVVFTSVVDKDKQTDSIQESGYSSCSDSANHSTNLPHLLRTSNYCWCDKEAASLYAKDVRIPLYVIQITILPFVPNPKLHKDTLQLHPMYEDEEGRCYIRRTASLRSITHQELGELTRLKTRNHFERVIQSLRCELVLFQNLYTSSILNHDDLPNSG